MCCPKRFLWIGLAQTLSLAAAFATTGPGSPAAGDPGWPRRYSDGKADLVVYQPQVDQWKDFKLLQGRCAFALTTVRGKGPVYGTFRFEGETLVDTDHKVVLLRNVRAFDMRFPSAPVEASPGWAELTKKLLPSDALVISLDRLLAYIQAGEIPRREAQILTDPPPIFVRTRPAALVILDGEPLLVDVKDSTLRRVINTNWQLYQDSKSSVLYLRYGKSWLTAKSLSDEFVRAKEIPADLAKLPAPDGGEPGIASLTVPPQIIVVHEPGELIVLQGAPQVAPVAGGLSWIRNTESDLFFHAASNAFYFLTSGRWFRSAALDGPWQYASASLPAEFKMIPADHPRAHVLAAVPGTREAEDAVLLAAIPRTAQVSRAEAKAEVEYVGSPEFAPIPGTSMHYATNTPNDVLRIGDLYYLCFQGVWFVSTSSHGPWQTADSVPQEIYTIPESSPKYNVTYVRIYESTPTTVIVGYTPGYYGAYVYGGVVVWGTGYYYPPYVAVGVAAVPVYWGSPYYTYGASAWYNPATGVYARGAAVYGPYGGYGAAAAYNPRTGVYAEGAAAWGPNGGVAAGRAYNPSTGNYTAGYAAANPYRSWGEGVVGNGNDLARGGYTSGSRGTVAAGETSKGGKGVAVQGANGNSGYVGKTGGGDVYAGANGNVYKRESGQWYSNQDGSWNAMSKGDVSAQRQQAAARERGNWNSQVSERARANGGFRSGGFERRPRPQGRPQIRRR